MPWPAGSFRCEFRIAGGDHAIDGAAAGDGSRQARDLGFVTAKLIKLCAKAVTISATTIDKLCAQTLSPGPTVGTHCPTTGPDAPRSIINKLGITQSRGKAMWVHVGQQPIVDTDGSAVAYEILFRSAATATSAEVRDAEESTAQVLTATFLEFGLPDLVGDRLAFINMPRGFLVGRWPLPFDAGRVVLEVLEDVQADDEVIAGISRLARAGYAIALDDVTATRGREELLHLADYVKLDLLDIDPADLPALVERCGGAARKIIAEKIETPEQLAACQGLGVELFQGYLLARPTTLTTSSLGPSQLSCLRLVSLLAEPDAPVREIAAAVEADPALAFKILRAANSAASGLSRRLSSIEEAVVMVGRQSLQGWATLMMLGTPATQTLLVAALVRACCCRTVSLYFSGDPAASFLTGLLSGLVEPLGITLPALLEQLSVSEEVSRSLLDGEGPLAPALAAVLAYQRGELPGSTSPITSAQLRHAYLDSVTWTQRTRTAVG